MTTNKQLEANRRNALQSTGAIASGPVEPADAPSSLPSFSVPPRTVIVIVVPAELPRS